MQLIGVKEIANYLTLSESTIMHMIQDQGMPAELNSESVWVSTSDLIDRWQVRESGKHIAVKPQIEPPARLETKKPATSTAKGKKTKTEDEDSGK